MKGSLRTVLALVFCLVIAASALSSCGGNKPEMSAHVTDIHQENGITSVLVAKNGQKLTISASLSESYIAANKREDVYIFEIPVGLDTSSLSVLTPAASFKVKDSHSVSLPLIDGNFTSLYSSFVLGETDGYGGYTPIGEPVYIMNPEAVAERTDAYHVSRSIKGIETESVYDALDLGASQVVLDVVLEDFLRGPSADLHSPVIDYVMNGISYHFDAALISELDTKILTLSDAGVTVYLRFLLNSPADTLKNGLDTLGYNTAESGALHYALNPNNGNCAPRLAAFFEFLAERYTRPDREYGFCASFIIGKNVNIPSVYNNAGVSPTLEKYAADYSLCVRLANIALSSVYSEGRVYISIGNNWNAPPRSDYAADASAADFLAAFSAETAKSGDFDWSIATAAHALDLADPSVWDDILATGASSQYVSPGNISTLTYAVSKGYPFCGNPRRIIIDSFAVTSAGGNHDKQAASYAYAYYKAAEETSVSAIIYSDLTDAAPSDISEHTIPEAGLAAYGGDLAVGAKKEIWDVFRTIDTHNDEPARAAGALCEGQFNYVYGNISERVKQNYLCTGSASVISSKDDYKLSPLVDFTEGSLMGAHSALPYSGVALEGINGKPALSIFGVGMRGAAVSGIDGERISGSKYIVLDLVGVTGRGSLTLRLADSANPELYYSSSVKYGTGSSSLCFNVSDFTDLCSSEEMVISIFVSPDVGSESSGLYISTIHAARPGLSFSKVLWTIVIILIVFFALMLLISAFSHVRHHSKRRRTKRRSNTGGQNRPSPAASSRNLPANRPAAHAYVDEDEDEDYDEEYDEEDDEADDEEED